MGQAFADIRSMLALTVVIRVSLMLVSVTLPISWIDAAAAGAGVIVGLTVLLARRRAVEQTTLVSASWWAVAALLAWYGAELAAGCSLATSSTTAALHYGAVTLSFCPV